MSTEPTLPGSPDVLTDVVAERAAEEQRTALRALLRRPLLTAADAAFVLVRRHREHLQEWLSEQAGWHLTVAADHARLRKLPAGPVDHTRPALARGRPFSRRRYVLWCLALAALERADSQTTLGWLADRIIDLAADPELVQAGVRFTLETRPERSDLVAVVRMLLDTGALARVAGDEEAYVNATGDALYDVDRRVLAAVLPGVRGPSTVTAEEEQERLDALVDTTIVDSVEARRRDARQRLTRRLLDDPVVYRDEVTAAERDYLDLPGQRHATARRVAATTGLVPELRAEGLAMLDPTGEASDVSMPAQGTQGHATLLLAEHLASAGTAGVAEIGRLVAGWAHTHPWSKASRVEGAEVGIAATAVGQLEALGLARVEGEVVRALPAIARYAVDQATLIGGGDA